MARPKLLVTVLLAVWVHLPAVAADDVDPLADCAEANLPDSTSVQNVEFRSIDRVGQGRTIKGRISWKRDEDGLSKAMLRIRAPEDLNGAGLLLIQKEKRTDMFIYLPDLKKVKRVSSHMLSGSLFGSDFTYEDFMQLQGIGLEGRHETLEDSTLDGVAVRVVAHYPSEEAGSSYERVVSYWDLETCIPIKTEMFERGDRLRKVLTADRDAIFRSNGTTMPQKLLMRDLRDDTSTELLIDDIEIGVKIPRKLFTTSGLERTGVR